jgi:hypothetical protein
MENGHKVTVLLDGSNHGIRLLFGCKREETAEEGYRLWRYFFLNSIFQYIEQFNADEFILALDDKNYWRKDLYPYYKGDRKIKRQIESAKATEEHWYDQKEYYQEFDRIVDEITHNLPIKVIKRDRTEADDIAGIIASMKSKEDDVKILITTDKDYIQLMSNNFTKVYNPIKKEFMECDDPKGDLLRKIMLGDKGDYVPSIKDKHIFKPEFLQYCVDQGVAANPDNAKIKLDADEDLLQTYVLEFYAKYQIKPSRVMAFSKKETNSLIEGDLLQDFLKKNPPLKKMFLRNNKLVNLTAQPANIKDAVIEEYENYEIKAGVDKLFEYFITSGYNDFMDNTTKIGNILEPLCE